MYLPLISPSRLPGSVRFQNNVLGSSATQTAIITPYELVKNHLTKAPANLGLPSKVPSDPSKYLKALSRNDGIFYNGISGTCFPLIIGTAEHNIAHYGI